MYNTHQGSQSEDWMRSREVIDLLLEDG
ncbi:addiction module toxin, HicA family, partial [Pseudomonas aeruginosa]